ncbi:very short patch repair endonuclease [Micromonospora zamorensis]|uniref:very short patch repair endonuclease n=1 Tax=Micromonospora zamorensis TaxID=709883 RepID=UPI0037BA6092
MLRRALRASGATGYRIHRASLPGKPDIAYTRWRLAIFVDGVFWHGHSDHFKPELASQYWREKIARNRERDQRNDAALTAMGWTVLRFWDMQVKDDLDGVTRVVAVALRELGRPDASTTS